MFMFSEDILLPSVDSKTVTQRRFLERFLDTSGLWNKHPPPSVLMVPSVRKSGIGIFFYF